MPKLHVTLHETSWAHIRDSRKRISLDKTKEPEAVRWVTESKGKHIVQTIRIITKLVVLSVASQKYTCAAQNNHLVIGMHGQT